VALGPTLRKSILGIGNSGNPGLYKGKDKSSKVRYSFCVALTHTQLHRAFTLNSFGVSLALRLT